MGKLTLRNFRTVHGEQMLAKIAEQAAVPLLAQSGIVSSPTMKPEEQHYFAEDILPRTQPVGMATIGLALVGRRLLQRINLLVTS